LCVAGGTYFLFFREPETRSRRPAAKKIVQVKVVKPSSGGLERTTTQPGIIHAYQYEDVFPGVSGFLTKQRVDAGDEVKEGDLLAQIDAPNVLEEEHVAAANLEKAKAEVKQMEARRGKADADLAAARTGVKYREAEKIRALANLKFRELRYNRYAGL